MNNTAELKSIIEYLGGSATTNDIVETYCKAHRMVSLPHFKWTIESTLSNNKEQFHRNKATGKWELISDINVEYLYVSSERRFSSISDIAKQVFNRNASRGGGYINIDSSHIAWFPKTENKRWDNRLSDDGKHLYEKPTDIDVSEMDDKTGDKLRYTFIGETGQYRFIGVFAKKGIENGARVFELVDDKVKIISHKEPLIVCYVAYMRYYNGKTEEDIPLGAGKWVEDNQDGGEANNFKNEEGSCYIYVQIKGNINLERISLTAKDKESIDGVKVVLCATKPDSSKRVVVGWYDNVTVYSKLVEEQNRFYRMKCSFENAHLIPEKDRTFTIPYRAGGKAAFGFGQSPIWYIQEKADCDESVKTFEISLEQYLESIKAEGQGASPEI